METNQESKQDWGAELDGLNEEEGEASSNESLEEVDEGEATPAEEPAPEAVPTETPSEEKPSEAKAEDPPAEEPPVEEKPKEGEGEAENPPEKEKSAEELAAEEAAKAEAETAKEEPAETWQGLETKALSELEKYYELSEEEKQMLDESPADALPKISARLHWRTYNSVLHAVSAMLPQAIGTHTQMSQAVTASENRFFEVHPELNKPEYTETVIRHINAYRTANPKADLETTIKEAGAAAKVALKVFAQGEPEKKETPHKPANAGAVNRPVPKDDDQNPWAKEYEEDLEE